MRISTFGVTDPGRRRSNNEDDLAVLDLTERRPIESHAAENREVGECGVLLAVCDGVGGRRAGEVASSLALEALSEEMESLAEGCPRRTLFGAAVENVNRRVWEKAQDDSSLEGMATTLTAAIVCRGRAILAHVGDSRAYLLRQGVLRQMTRDQSFVASLVSSGALTPEQAAQSPYRNVIMQAIGRQKTVEVGLDAVDLEAGDQLLLCTDGLSEKVPAEEMARLMQTSDLRRSAEELVALANARGGEDNITVLIGRIEEEP